MKTKEFEIKARELNYTASAPKCQYLKGEVQMIFSELFKKRKLKKNVRMIPCYAMQYSFDDTVEGCSLWNWDRNKESYYAVKEIFKTFPDGVKHALTFDPKDGEFCDMVNFWKAALKPALPPVLYYNAMHRIYRCYKRIKRIRQAERATQAAYTNMMREV